MTKNKQSSQWELMQGIRKEWGFNPKSRVVPNKKGKGSYDRKEKKENRWN